jgi:hypothetical protein
MITIFKAGNTRKVFDDALSESTPGAYYRLEFYYGRLDGDLSDKDYKEIVEATKRIKAVVTRINKEESK